MEEGAFAQVVTFGVLGAACAVLGFAILFVSTGAPTSFGASRLYALLFLGAFVFFLAAFTRARDSREGY